MQPHRQEMAFSGVVNFADELDLLVVDVRLKAFLEVGGLGARYLGGDVEWLSGGACNADSVFRTLLGSQASEKRQILPLFV